MLLPIWFGAAAEQPGTAAPEKGSITLGYGPIYNLEAAANARLVESQRFVLSGRMNFNGFRYASTYPGINYDGKVTFRRNNVAANLKSTLKTSHGSLDVEAGYRFSGYNFPILDLPTLATDKHVIDANIANVTAAWKSSAKGIDYSVRAKFGMIAMGRNAANNYIPEIAATLVWHASSASTWRVDASFSFDRSQIVGNKAVACIIPGYRYAGENVKLTAGVNISKAAVNCANPPKLFVAPDIDIAWQPHSHISLYAKTNGHIDSNSRIKLFDEQAYLLPDFDAGFSRIYNAEAGVNAGSFAGVKFGAFAGFTKAFQWYIPALATGYMSPISSVSGWHWGATLAYDYRRLLSANLRAEFANSRDGNYAKGYAPWRDHARMNLVANATVHPSATVALSLGYHMRGGRQKQLPRGNLNLRTISNLKGSVQWQADARWVLFVRGENLLNHIWYQGPAVPCRGITALVGATYKL